MTYFYDQPTQKKIVRSSSSDFALPRSLSRFCTRKRTLLLTAHMPHKTAQARPTLLAPVLASFHSERNLNIFCHPYPERHFFCHLLRWFGTKFCFILWTEVCSSPAMSLSSMNWTLNPSTLQEATDKTRRCCYVIQVSIGTFDVVFT